MEIYTYRQNNYITSLYKDYLQISDYLPESNKNILDIGCGVGEINIFLNKHFKNKKLNIFLLDKTIININIFYDFHSIAPFYNSLDISKKFLMMNDIHGENICKLYANDRKEITIKDKIELVISLFHRDFTTLSKLI